MKVNDCWACALNGERRSDGAEIAVMAMIEVMVRENITAREVQACFCEKHRDEVGGTAVSVYGKDKP